jgi:hypothetical protein
MSHTDSHFSCEEQTVDNDVISSGNHIENDDLDDSRKKKVRPMSSDSDIQITAQNEHVSLRFMIEKHPIYEQWLVFIRTQLAAAVTTQGTALGGLNSQVVTNLDQSSRDLQNDSNFVTDDYSYSNNDPIELDENDLDVAASMMDALTIPSSERGHEPKCYIYEDPLGNGGRHFESELDNYEESHSKSEVIGDEDNEYAGDAPVMDLYAGNFSLRDVSEHLSPDDFNNFGTDWANFDEAFEVKNVDNLFGASNEVTAEEHDFPFASAI